MADAEEKNIAVNKRARHEYHVEETYEAGLVLTGSEVKSLRDGRLTFKDSHISLRRGEAFWLGAHISGYVYAHQNDHDPERERKLLLHRQELQRLTGKVREKGLALVPLRVYTKNGRIKLEFALAKGKKEHDKRDDLKAKDATREMARAMSYRR